MLREVVASMEPVRPWLGLRTEGERLRGLGAFQPAEPLLREAVSATELDAVAGALELAASLNALGLLCKDLARYDEASELYQRAMALVSTARESRATSRALATLYHNLGGIDHARGRFQSAEVLARRGVTIRAEIDEDEADLAVDLVGLAAIVEARGRFDEAESLYEEGLAILERGVVRRELEIAVALASLGALHARCESFAVALVSLARAVTIKRRVLGAAHPDLALTLNNLAFVRERLNDVDEAEALYLEATSICDAALGSQHPRTLACRHNLDRFRERTRATHGSSRTSTNPIPRRETDMSKNNEPDLIRIVLSPEQQQKIKTATGREVEAIELTIQELEPRITPSARLAANHNESLLTA